MAFIKTNNFNFRFPLYIGKFWLLLLMSVSLKMNAEVYVSDKTVFTVKGNTTIYNFASISDDVLQSNSKSTKIVKVYITEGTLITNFPSDSLHEIVYLEKEKPSEKSIKETARKINKKEESKLIIKNSDDLKEKELFTVFKSKKGNSSIIFSSGNRLNAICAPSFSFVLKSIFDKFKQEKKYHALLFDIGNQQVIKFSRDNLRKPQHLLQEQITRPPPFLDFDSPLRFLI